MMNGDTMSQMAVVLAVALHVLIFGIALWDVWVVMQGRPNDTVSTIMAKWAKTYPMFPLTVGVIIGHLFWK